MLTSNKGRFNTVDADRGRRSAGCYYLQLLGKDRQQYVRIIIASAAMSMKKSWLCQHQLRGYQTHQSMHWAWGSSHAIFRV